MYYIYIFRVKKDGKIIYVGSTRTIGSRLNEHRRGMREIEREQPIHKYLKSNNLSLITDVEFSVIDYAESKQEALEKESYYFNKYQKTLVNIWDAEDRTETNSPVRKPLVSADGKLSFASQREASRYFGISRYQVFQKVKAGELIEVDVDGKFKNEATGEVFISAYQLGKRYNLDSKRLNELSKKGTLIINGMTIRKV
nr:MAG TPA: intron associated endonuclease [Caudoviricetes sp.]